VVRTWSVARSRIPGVTATDLCRWAKTGLLRLSNPGTGRRRRYPPEEVRAARALDAHRRLAGVDPSKGLVPNPAYRRLQVAVANAARNNPPGTVVEIPSPVSWVRTIVVVPEP
jgi:hypothetical protein